MGRRSGSQAGQSADGAAARGAGSLSPPATAPPRHRGCHVLLPKLCPRAAWPVASSCALQGARRRVPRGKEDTAVTPGAHHTRARAATVGSAETQVFPSLSRLFSPLPACPLPPVPPSPLSVATRVAQLLRRPRGPGTEPGEPNTAPPVPADTFGASVHRRRSSLGMWLGRASCARGTLDPVLTSLVS